MADQGNREAPPEWRELHELIEEYVRADAEDDAAFERVRDRLQTRAVAWVERWPGEPRR